MIKRLQDHDFDALESYWIRFSTLSDVEDEKKKKNVEIIKRAIESQYNESEGRLRAFIEIRYFGSAASEIEAVHELQDLHGIKKPTYNRIREILLTDTAERIGWV